MKYILGLPTDDVERREEFGTVAALTELGRAAGMCSRSTPSAAAPDTSEKHTSSRALRGNCSNSDDTDA